MQDRAYNIRAACADDARHLPEIEREAAKMFTGLEPELGMPVGERLEVNTIETFSGAIHCGHVWVATDSDNRSVGFALMSEIDGNAHLEELDVDPDHGRRGIGSDLVETVCDWATSRGFQFVTLSTFRDVPWNRRFYEILRESRILCSPAS